MKKFLAILLVSLFCLVSTNAFASYGDYSVTSLTINPPGGAWGNPAELEVGSAYTVDLSLAYAEAFFGDGFADILTASLAIGSETWSDTKSTTTKDQPVFDTVKSATWDFQFSILDDEITEAMIGEELAYLNIGGMYHDFFLDETIPVIAFVGEYPINITNPDGEVPPGGQVPEPATMMLFGLGLLGLAGVSRRKTA